MTRTNTFSRRKFIGRSIGVAAATAIAPMINFGRFQVHAASSRTYSQRAIELVERYQVIDMLSLLRPLDSLFPKSPVENLFVLSDQQIEKLKSSGVNIFHPALGLDNDREKAYQFVAGWNSLITQYHQHFVRVDSLADMDTVKQSGKIGIIIGVQNAAHFHSLDDVNHFYNLGQRVSQLTYNTRNLIGTGSTDRADGGLSDFGVGIVERMNEVGMIVDVSHCGDKTTLDAIELSKKPVLITHSNSRVLAGGHPRCKPDEAIKKMAEKGGVMGITGVRQFVSGAEPTGLDQVLDHFDHVARLVGVEHVGVGSDMDPDGYDDMSPENKEALRSLYKQSYAFRDKFDADDFNHPLRIYDLTDGLIKRGYGDDDIGLILGGNFKRAIGNIWQV